MRCLCFRARSDSADHPIASIAPAPLKDSTSLEYDDPRIPLTKKQKFILTKNWKGIARDVTEAGANMFVKMLSENTDYYRMFAFRDVAESTKEEQLRDEKLRGHGETVMGLIGDMICSIEDGDKFFSIVKQSGRNHAYKKYFQPEMFWKMEQPFLFAVKLTLGERYTDNMDHIYKVVIHLIIQKMEEACKDEFKRLQNNGSLANGQQ